MKMHKNNDENDCNIFGENKIDRLIVMEPLPCHENSVTLVCISSTYFLRWRFSVFPICHTVWRHVNILTNYCDRETINQITARDLGKNRLYFALSFQSKNSCLKIDCRKSGPPKYRTEAENFTIMAKIKRTGFTINF